MQKISKDPSRITSTKTKETNKTTHNLPPSFTPTPNPALPNPGLLSATYPVPETDVGHLCWVWSNHTNGKGLNWLCWDNKSTTNLGSGLANLSWASEARTTTSFQRMPETSPPKAFTLTYLEGRTYMQKPPKRHIYLQKKHDNYLTG